MCSIRFFGFLLQMYQMSVLDNVSPLFDMGCIPIHPSYMAVGQNLVPLVNIKIAGKWMFIPLKIVLISIDS